MRDIIDVESLKEITDLTDGPSGMVPQMIDLTEDDEIEEVPGPNSRRIQSPPSAINPDIGKKYSPHPNRGVNSNWSQRDVTSWLAPWQPSSSKRTLEVIDVDNEVEVPESKAPKFHDEDSETEYTSIYDALLVNDPRNWQALNLYADQLDVPRNLGDTLQKLTLGLQHGPQFVSKISQQRPKSGPSSKYIPIWENMKLAVDKRSTTHHGALFSHTDHGVMPLMKLKLVDQYKYAPGAINKIAQKNGCIAVGSASLGGQPDQPDETGPDPYNKDGALTIWKGKPYVLTGHYKEISIPNPIPNQPQLLETKYYAVNNLCFDSCSDVLVSLGNDKSVLVWVYDDDEEKYVWARKWGQSCVSAPSEIAFQENGPAFAVGERKLHIWSGLEVEEVISDSFQIGKRKDHEVATLAWGQARTEHLVFASSAPIGDGYDGTHQAIDVQTQSISWTFNNSEAGCCMSLKPGGETLALVTQPDENMFKLKLFDVKGANGTPHASIDIQFHGDSVGEINMATWSPDGIFLAIARNDNSTHVYDMRMLSDDPLFVYQHRGPSAVNPGHESFGVVSALWTTSLSERPYLITGGDDGCVRMWNPLKSREDTSGVPIMQADSDIAALHIGDPHQGQYPLVVGDGSGQVYIYDVHGF
ncbi:WD40 repeat-like protein [Pluteus cervinus]|uniref:WD40 repeat-like protein n=1 Tax=Pluteus cervinus TaxID=181527 RepID=A0ACD3BBI0_9AGAR|nr:WD40 repeat-like protein [Pluteus cervinus]